jgi:lysophospholipase
MCARVRDTPDAIESMWLAADGAAIRTLAWPAPEGPSRGSILFLPGRADFYEKYLETFEDWRSRGWHVSAADWRGQAGSGRLAADPAVGDIADFSIWVDDLAGLFAQWRAGAPGPHVVAGHSMGGHLVLRALAEGRSTPTRSCSAHRCWALPRRFPACCNASMPG